MAIPELQQPNIAGNFLSSYYAAQQQEQQKADRERRIKREDVVNAQQDSQFQYQEQLRKAEAIGRAAVEFDTPEKWQSGAPTVMQSLGIQGPVPDFSQRGRIIAEAQSVTEQLNRKFQDRQQTETERNHRAMEAAARAKTAASIPPGAAPGYRQPPPGVEGRDSADIKDMRKTSDAAANIANTLVSVAPALNASAKHLGPGFETQRGVAGVLSVIPGVTAIEKWLTGDSHTENIINNFDAIKQASETIGIDILQKVGGSDTERELATAIRTTVNPNAPARENARRYRDQLLSAQILSAKADLATQWINKFGALSYASPDGMTWARFWSQYQKAAWADGHRAEPQVSGGGSAPTGGQALPQGAPPPPPGTVVR